MDEFFPNIYHWFSSLFGNRMEDYLWGYSCDTLSYVPPFIFNYLGLIAVALSILFVIAYYYIINHPRFNRWWHWGIVLFLSGVVNLFIGFGWTYSDLINGLIPECLLGEWINEVFIQRIFASHCWGVGIANFFVSIGFFIIFSFCFKWGSRNCKYSPFIKF